MVTALHNIKQNKLANTYFKFKQFTVHQDCSAMKVTTDSCLFGAWVAQTVKAIPFCNLHEKKVAALDIGTGTGLLSLMLAQQHPRIHIDAIEIDERAAQQAAENIGGSPWPAQVRVVHADVRSFTASQPYDVMISNPPFYEKELKGDDTRKNIAHHNEGLLLPELMAVISKNLARQGIFFLLLPYRRLEEIKLLLAQYGLTAENIVLVRQSEDHDFFRILLQGAFAGSSPQTTKQEEIAIKTNNGTYTPDFERLLRDYYLAL